MLIRRGNLRNWRIRRLDSDVPSRIRVALFRPYEQRARLGVFGASRSDCPRRIWMAAGYSDRLEQSTSFFIGLTLGATSVSISAQTLMELQLLRSRVGFGLLGAAVF